MNKISIIMLSDSRTKIRIFFWQISREQFVRNAMDI